MTFVETVKGELRFDGFETVIRIGGPTCERPIEVDLDDDTSEIEEEGIY
jgi:hypothetical protein